MVAPAPRVALPARRVALPAPRGYPHDMGLSTRLYLNAHLWSAPAGPAADGPPALQAIAEQGGRIAAVGEPLALRRRFPDAEHIDLGGRLVTPGLIDCHTHLVYAGDRTGEIERRLAGDSYQGIAAAGGGILSTVAATRAASLAQLTDGALVRADALLAEGVTTIEIKSGYGLDRDTELRSLQAARALGERRSVSIRTTYLGAHALPPEHAGDPAGFLERLATELIPTIAASGWADAFDAYCEQLAFTAAQLAPVLAAAQRHGLPVKLHADQLSNMQAAALAARFHALSADHLEYTDEAGVAALAAAGTVAVLLPGAFHFLRERQPPPVAALRRAGVPIAVATDCNPGTSPLTSLLTAMNLAAVDFGLSVGECLAGVTREAARALGVLPETGSIDAGKWCDLAVWNVAHPAELVLSLGRRPLHCRIWRGRRDGG